MPLAQISNGEAGLSVRSKLNGLLYAGPVGLASYGASGVGRLRSRVLMGIDSLTDGGGSPSSSYRTSFYAALRALCGDGGAGLTHVDDDCEGAVTFDNVNGPAITGLAWSDARRVKSFFGRGRYYNNVTAGTFNWRFANATTGLAKYASATMWIEFTAVGQVFSIKAYAGANPFWINITATSAMLNKPIPVHYPLSNQSGSVGIAMSVNTNGANDLFIWAKELHPVSDVGIQFTNIGIGGSTIAEWLNLDAARFAAWMQIVRPDVTILNGGMNDRGSGLNNANVYADKVPAAIAVAQNYETLALRFASGWPQGRGILVCPNDTADNATTVIGYLPEYYLSIARSIGWAFHNDQALFGSYATALANGDMEASGVHPSSAGNAKRGAAYAGMLVA